MMAKKLITFWGLVLMISGLVYCWPEHVQAAAPAAFQPFEGGYMIWRGETGEIWALTFADWQARLIPQAAYENLPDNPVPDEPPAGRVKPVSGFGRVWGNFPDLRQALGWALAGETGYVASFQPASFSGGGLQQTLVNLPDGREVLLRADHSWQENNGQPRSIWSLHNPLEIPATMQLFEHGALIWWSETGSIWVLNTETRQATHFDSLSYGALPDNPVTQPPPPGLVKPIMGFGKVWGHFPAVREALGWATGPSQSYRLGFVRRPADTGFNCELSHPNLGTITITGNTWQGTLPANPTPGPPPASNGTTVYTSLILHYSFAYPDDWFLQIAQDAGHGFYETVHLTSYNPADGEPAHAAFADPALVKLTFFGHIYGAGGTLDAWVNQYKAQVDGVTQQIVNERMITLPGGIPAIRLDMVSGTGGYPVLLTVIADSRIKIEGLMADYAVFDSVVSTLRAAP